MDSVSSYGIKWNCKPGTWKSGFKIICCLLAKKRRNFRIVLLSLTPRLMISKTSFFVMLYNQNIIFSKSFCFLFYDLRFQSDPKLLKVIKSFTKSLSSGLFLYAISVLTKGRFKIRPFKIFFKKSFFFCRKCLFSIRQR